MTEAADCFWCVIWVPAQKWLITVNDIGAGAHLPHNQLLSYTSKKKRLISGMCTSATMTLTIQFEQFSAFTKQTKAELCKGETIAARKNSRGFSLNSCLSQDGKWTWPLPSSASIWVPCVDLSLSSHESHLAVWHMPKWVCQGCSGACVSHSQLNKNIVPSCLVEGTRTSKHGCDGPLQNIS